MCGAETPRGRLSRWPNFLVAFNCLHVRVFAEILGAARDSMMWARRGPYDVPHSVRSPPLQSAGDIAAMSAPTDSAALYTSVPVMPGLRSLMDPARAIN